MLVFPKVILGWFFGQHDCIRVVAFCKVPPIMQIYPGTWNYVSAIFAAFDLISHAPMISAWVLSSQPSLASGDMEVPSSVFSVGT